MKKFRQEKINDRQELPELKFEKIREEVKKIPHIDDGIVETVAALRAHGFATNWSCSGHPEGYETEEGHHIDAAGFDSLAPDVRIAVPGVEELRLAKDGLPDDDDDASRKYNSKVYERLNGLALKYELGLATLLEEFYRDRHISYGAMIHFFPDSAYEFWIENNGRRALKFFTRDDQQKAAKLFKKEFDAFTEFLKKKFFESAR